jgi:hypothetical protein
MKLPEYLQHSMRGIVLEGIMLHLKCRTAEVLIRRCMIIQGHLQCRGHLMSTLVIMFIPSRAKRFLSSPQSPGQL